MAPRAGGCDPPPLSPLRPPSHPPPSAPQARIKPRPDGRRIVEGRVFVCGDNIDTDQIIPAEYLTLVPSKPDEYEQLGAFAMIGLPEDAYPTREWGRGRRGGGPGGGGGARRPSPAPVRGPRAEAEGRSERGRMTMRKS